MDVKNYWNDIITQNRETIRSYFHEDATIRWHCTNEQFTVSEYIRVNCDYSGDWTGELERIEETGSGIVVVGRVMPEEGGPSFHVVSFIRLENDLIIERDEYWSEDGDAPSWRNELFQVPT